MKTPGLKGGAMRFAAALLVFLPQAAFSQITDDAGDGVLNAPYRGTIDSLREATMDIGYGEVQTHVEPIVANLQITSSDIKIWHETPSGSVAWDRSILRLYRGVDASGPEIDLTNRIDVASAFVLNTPATFERFSLRAMGTKTLAVQEFTIKFDYQPAGVHVRTFRVAPVTASFVDLQQATEAFHFGTPLLSVRAGDAQLTVPTGLTAVTLGATFIDERRRGNMGLVPVYEVLFPGAAESVFIQHISQFRLSEQSFAKTAFGTPWPGHLIGFHASTDVYGPDYSRLDLLTGTAFGFNKVINVVPLGVGGGHPAIQTYTYDVFDRATQIRDNAKTTSNYIDVERNGAGVVQTITTSDMRSWTILSDPIDNWITGIVPAGGIGARYFKYNSFGRITQIRLGAGDGGDPTNPDLGDQSMYKFVYDSAGDLREEWRFVDGQLRQVIDHVVISEALRQRKEYFGPGANDYRRFDLAYDTTATPPLRHRLKTLTSYSGPAGSGVPYMTTYTHKVGLPSDSPNTAGTMVITQVALPDGTTLNHEYDSRVGGPLVNYGLRSKTTRTGPDDGALVTFDIDYEFTYVQMPQTPAFSWPRITKVRDGRGILSEVIFDYEDGFADQNGDDFLGRETNQLLSRTGPMIFAGFSGMRTPQS